MAEQNCLEAQPSSEQCSELRHLREQAAIELEQLKLESINAGKQLQDLYEQAKLEFAGIEGMWNEKPTSDIKAATLHLLELLSRAKSKSGSPEKAAGQTTSAVVEQPTEAVTKEDDLDIKVLLLLLEAAGDGRMAQALEECLADDGPDSLPFHLLASVGTWFMRLQRSPLLRQATHCQANQSDRSESIAVVTEIAAALGIDIGRRRFMESPSVGTWYLEIPNSVKVALNAGDEQIPSASPSDVHASSSDVGTVYHQQQLLKHSPSASTLEVEPSRPPSRLDVPSSANKSAFQPTPPTTAASMSILVDEVLAGDLAEDERPGSAVVAGYEQPNNFMAESEDAAATTGIGQSSVGGTGLADAVEDTQLVAQPAAKPAADEEPALADSVVEPAFVPDGEQSPPVDSTAPPAQSCPSAVTPGPAASEEPTHSAVDRSAAPAEQPDAAEQAVEGVVPAAVETEPAAAKGLAAPPAEQPVPLSDEASPVLEHAAAAAAPEPVTAEEASASAVDASDDTAPPGQPGVPGPWPEPATAEEADASAVNASDEKVPLREPDQPTAAPELATSEDPLPPAEEKATPEPKAAQTEQPDATEQAAEGVAPAVVEPEPAAVEGSAPPPADQPVPFSGEASPELEPALAAAEPEPATVDEADASVIDASDEKLPLGESQPTTEPEPAESAHPLLPAEEKATPEPKVGPAEQPHAAEQAAEGVAPAIVEPEPAAVEGSAPPPADQPAPLSGGASPELEPAVAATEPEPATAEEASASAVDASDETAPPGQPDVPAAEPEPATVEEASVSAIDASDEKLPLGEPSQPATEPEPAESADPLPQAEENATPEPKAPPVEEAVAEEQAVGESAPRSAEPESAAAEDQPLSPIEEPAKAAHESSSPEEPAQPVAQPEPPTVLESSLPTAGESAPAVDRTPPSAEPTPPAVEPEPPADAKASEKGRQARAAATIQGFVRTVQARKSAGEKLTFARVAEIVLARVREWKHVFENASNGKPYLDAETFAVGLIQVHRRFSKSQAFAVYAGFQDLTELDTMDLKVFRWVVEAAHIGDEPLADWADMRLADFHALVDTGTGGYHKRRHRGDIAWPKESDVPETAEMPDIMEMPQTVELPETMEVPETVEPETVEIPIRLRTLFEAEQHFDWLDRRFLHSCFRAWRKGDRPPWYWRVSPEGGEYYFQ